MLEHLVVAKQAVSNFFNLKEQQTLLAAEKKKHTHTVYSSVIRGSYLHDNMGSRSISTLSSRCLLADLSAAREFFRVGRVGVQKLPKVTCKRAESQP